MPHVSIPTTIYTRSRDIICVASQEKEFQLLQEQFGDIVKQVENGPKEENLDGVLESLETQNVKLKHRIAVLKEVYFMSRILYHRCIVR